jgi:hypothetical protein
MTIRITYALRTLMDWSHYNPAMNRLVEIYSKWGGASVDALRAADQIPALPVPAGSAAASAAMRCAHRIGIIALGTWGHWLDDARIQSYRRARRSMPDHEVPRPRARLRFDRREPAAAAATGEVCGRPS